MKKLFFKKLVKLMVAVFITIVVIFFAVETLSSQRAVRVIAQKNITNLMTLNR